jgi:D-amino-acid oxidase
MAKGCRVGNGFATTLLPDPDFTCTPTDCVFVAGIRPYRQTTFRLEAQTLGTKFVVHNYGHGGAGITMCWGCAVEVRNMVRQHAGSALGPVAVLGAGVMGLTAATLLAQSGFAVRIYAASLTSTTSDIAGGQWCPSFVEREQTAAAKQQFEDILRTSFNMHVDRIGQGYGVAKRINYSKYNSGTSFDKVPRDVIPAPTEFQQLPFVNLNQKGYGYHTLLVEPPIFLKKLRDDLAASVPFTQMEFESQAQIAELQEPIVVNCTGMGARHLFGDTKLVPIKGHLVLLRRQLNLDYLYSSDKSYVFPRNDHVVVGGSFEAHVYDPVDPAKCQAILQLAKDVFAGAPTVQLPPQPWMLPDYGDEYR